MADEIIRTGPQTFVGRFTFENLAPPVRKYERKGRYYCKSCKVHTDGVLESVNSEFRQCPVCKALFD